MLAVVASLFIVLMNAGPFAISALAWGNWNDKPNWEQPNWETPEYEKPDWNSSDSGSHTKPPGKESGDKKADSPSDSGAKDGDGSGSKDQDSKTDINQDKKPYPFKDNLQYNQAKFVTNTLLFPAIKGLDRDLWDMDWKEFGKKYKEGLTKSVLKLQLGKMFSSDNALGIAGNIGLDTWSAIDHAKHVKKFLGSWNDVKSVFSTASRTGSFSTAASGSANVLNKLTKPFEFGGGIAGKAAPWLAAVSTGISGAETIMNFGNKDYNDGIASLGETLMSGAIVLSATGVGAPIAAGVAVTGGLLWAGAKVYKHHKAITNYVSTKGKKIAEGVGKAVKFVKGWFK